MNLEKKMLTKPISVLHPIGSWRCSRSRCIAEYIVKSNISPVHDIYAPHRRVFDVKIQHSNRGDIPENEWHRSSGLSIAGFSCVPDIAIAVNATGSISVNADVMSADDKPGIEIPLIDWNRMIAPVGNIIRKLVFLVRWDQHPEERSISS